MEAIETQIANRLATGAPGSIELGGQTYLVSQPTKADFVTLRKHLASTLKKTAVTPLAAIAPELQGLPPDLQRMAIEAAVKIKDGGREATGDNITDLLLEPSGVAFWAWILCRKNHPQLFLSTLESAITVDNVDQVIAELIEANGLKEVSPN